MSLPIQRIQTWLTLVGVVAIAAGCAAPLPSSAPTTGPTPTLGGPAPTELPVSSGSLETPPAPPPSVAGLPSTEDPNATPQALPSVHAEPSLDELIGISVRGVTLVTASLTGEDAAAGGGYLGPLLTTIGAPTSDLSTALAEDPQHQLELVIFAIKVRDVEAARLLQAFDAVTGNADATDVVVAGKTVQRIPTEWTSYVYATGDVLLIVQTPDDALAEEALAQLP